MVKNPSAVQELQGMQVQSLGQEDPLEREMATHSSILAWRNPWTKEPGRLQSMGSQESDTTEQLNKTHAPAMKEEVNSNATVGTSTFHFYQWTGHADRKSVRNTGLKYTLGRHT